MSPEPRVWRNRTSESGTRYHRARLVDRDGSVLDQSSFTGTITAKIFDLDGETPETAVYSNASNLISSWVFNSLQTWEDDEDGYNFEGYITSNQYAYEGGHSYRVCFYLNRASGTPGDGALAVLFENKVEWQLGA